MHPTYLQILARLEAFGRVKQARRALSWHAHCPVHGDRSPSLSVWVGGTGDLLVKCWANRGCTFGEIVKALGTPISDWFPPREENDRNRNHHSRRKVYTMPEPEAVYDYFDERGELVMQVVRYQRDEKGRKVFRQRRPNHQAQHSCDEWIWDTEGVTKPIFNLPEIRRQPRQPVLIVEGEKDVLTARSLGFLATCNPGGAGKWLYHHGSFLRGRRVVIIPDNDEPGHQHAGLVAGNCLMWGVASLRIIHLLGPDGGDLTDWVDDAFPGASLNTYRQLLIELVQAAPEWTCGQPGTRQR